MAPTLLFIYLAMSLNRDGHESANKILARIYPKTGQSLPQNWGMISAWPETRVFQIVLVLLLILGFSRDFEDDDEDENEEDWIPVVSGQTLIKVV
jgi:hypothetical protein